MKIEKTECSYQVTECDLKFGEQITLDGELLIPVSVLDKIRKEIEVQIVPRSVYTDKQKKQILAIIDKYRNEVNDGHMD